MNIHSVFFNKKNIYKSIYMILLVCICTSYLSIFSSSIYSQSQPFDEFCIRLMSANPSILEEDKPVPLNRYLFRNLPLETKEDKIKALFIITQDIPELFNQSSDFPIDFMEVLDSNRSLLSSIRESIPEYDKILQSRPNLLDINIVTSQEQQYSDRTTSEEDVDKWILSLKNTLSYLNKDYSDTLMIDILYKLLDIYTHTLNFNGILGALRGIIPNSRVFDKDSSLSFQERIDILSEDLPNDFKEGIIKWNLVIKSEELNKFLSNFSDKEKILYILNSQSHLFNLISILMIHSTHQKNLTPMNNEFHIEPSRFFQKTLEDLKTLYLSDIEKIIESFQDEDLKSLDDVSFIRKNLLTTTLDTKYKNIASISSLISSNAKAYLSSKTLNETKGSISIRIKEVLPISALFRGYVGSDCSSSNSFAYPNDPFERVFFIYNDKNQAIGYISSTEILIDGKKSLYINTIAGSHLSSYHIRVVLDGLNNIKKELQVESISYPIASIIKEVINQPIIAKELNYRIENKAPIEAGEFNLFSSLYSYALPSLGKSIFRYQHEPIRNFISKFKADYNTPKYDGIGENYRLRIDTSSINPKLNITVTERTYNSSEYEFSAIEFYKKIIISLWKSIEKEGFKSQNLKNILLIINLDEEQIVELYEDLSNKNKLDLSHYLSYIKEKYGIELNIENLSLETLARISDFNTNKDLQALFIKKLRRVKIESIYFKDSFQILAERIRFLLSTISSRQLAELNQNELFTILVDPKYVSFKKVSQKIFIGVRADNKLDIFQQGIGTILKIVDLDSIEQIQDRPVFIIEKDKKFDLLTPSTLTVMMDLDKIKPIELEKDSRVYSQSDLFFKVYANGKCGIVRVCFSNGMIFSIPVISTRYGSIEYKAVRNGNNRLLEYFKVRSDTKIGIMFPHFTKEVLCMYDEISDEVYKDIIYIRLVENGKKGLMIIYPKPVSGFYIRKLDTVYDRIDISNEGHKVTAYTENSYSVFNFR